MIIPQGTNLIERKLGMLIKPDYKELERRVKYDIEAFSDLYEHNYRMIFNYILYNTTDIEIALDLTAETFLKAFRFRGRFDYKRASFSSWLFGIASKEIAMYFRKQSREHAFPISNFTFSSDVEDARRSVNQEEIADARIQLEICDEFMDLSLALRELPEKSREILTLRLIDDLSFEEIASMLCKKVETVKSRYYRTLKKLRKILQDTPTSRVALGKIAELPEDAYVIKGEGE